MGAVKTAMGANHLQTGVLHADGLHFLVVQLTDAVGGEAVESGDGEALSSDFFVTGGGRVAEDVDVGVGFVLGD